MARQRRKTATKERNRTISRRKFLQDVMVASAATSVVAAALPAGAAAATSVPAETEALKVLTSEESSVLTLVLNRLVPAEGAMPGAGDVGIAAFIDNAMHDGPHLRRPILDVLSEVARAGAGSPVSGDELDDRLRQIQQQHPDAFKILLQATYTGYYSDPRVLAEIGWVPAELQKDEPFDAAILEDVVKRGPIFTHA